MKTKAVEIKTNRSYQSIEKNIYKVGKSYRVRVNGHSIYTSNLTKARKVRKMLKDNSVNEFVY